MKQLTPEQLALLKKPLPKGAIKQHPTKKFLSTIKAIYIVERLNDVFGIGGWVAKNEVVEKVNAWVVVKTTFEAPEYGIKVLDIFGGNDNPDLGDAYKGACTDALSKIGSYLYIGMDVYKGLSDKPQERGMYDDTITAWEVEINKCKTKTDLLALYNGNKATIDNDQAIKDLFKNRDNQIKK